MGIFKPINTVRGRDSSGSDNELSDPLSAGLDVPATLPTLMIVGALCHPLHQNSARMVGATLCTHAQLVDGMTHLHAFVKEYYEKLEYNDVNTGCGGGSKTNRYDVPTNPDHTCRNSPAILAEKEIKQFFANNNYRYLPKMEGHRTLGVVDARGQPRDPVYELGPVTEAGDDFYVCGTFKLNHANFVDAKGYFDICQFYNSTKFMYPGIANTFLGKLGHHSCQEADCETLFSMSGYKSEARRNNALIRTYERLVIASHRMHRFHICDKVIIEAYLKRIREKSWDDQECRDDEEFLKFEKELWSQMYPEQARALDEEDMVSAEVGAEAELTSSSDSNNLPTDSLDEGDVLGEWFDDPIHGDVMGIDLPSTKGEGV